MGAKLYMAPDKLPLEKHWWMLHLFSWALGIVTGSLANTSWSAWIAAFLAAWVSERISLGWRMNRVALVTGSALLAGTAASLAGSLYGWAASGLLVPLAWAWTSGKI